MRRASARWQPVAIALLACAGLAGFAGYDLHRERQIAVRQARMATANAAGLVDAQVRQAFGRVLLALDQAQSDLVGLPGFPADAEAWRAVLEPTVRSAATPDGLVRGLQLFDPQGRLLAGTVRSGGRSIVFEGLVTAGLLEETIDLALETDGRTLVSAETLQFYFEVESR